MCCCVVQGCGFNGWSGIMVPVCMWEGVFMWEWRDLCVVWE